MATLRANFSSYGFGDVIIGSTILSPTNAVNNLGVYFDPELSFRNQNASVWSCGGQLFFSCLGHMCVVMMTVWMGVGVIRLTPTHSRGTILGTTFAMATLGHSLAILNINNGLYFLEYWGIYGQVVVWASVSFIGCLFALMLPKMPKSLPDTLTHLTFLKSEQEKVEDYEESQNTQL